MRCFREINRPNSLFLFFISLQCWCSRQHSYLPVDTASYPKRIEYSSALLWAPPNTNAGYWDVRLLVTEDADHRQVQYQSQHFCTYVRLFSSIYDAQTEIHYNGNSIVKSPKTKARTIRTRKFPHQALRLIMIQELPKAQTRRVTKASLLILWTLSVSHRQCYKPQPDPQANTQRINHVAESAAFIFIAESVSYMVIEVLSDVTLCLWMYGSRRFERT